MLSPLDPMDFCTSDLALVAALYHGENQGKDRRAAHLARYMLGLHDRIAELESRCTEAPARRRGGK